jgi:hypothetical protein
MQVRKDTVEICPLFPLTRHEHNYSTQRMSVIILSVFYENVPEMLELH